MLSELFRNIPFRTLNGAQNDPLGDPNGAHHITSHHISGANSHRCPILRQVEVWQSQKSFRSCVVVQNLEIMPQMLHVAMPGAYQGSGCVPVAATVGMDAATPH